MVKKLIFFILAGGVLKAANGLLYGMDSFILAGPVTGEGRLGLREMGLWLLLFLPFFICAGYELETDLEQMYTKILRYGSYGRWLKKLQWGIVTDGGLYLLILFFWNLENRGTMMKWAVSLFLLWLHMIFLMQILIVIRYKGVQLPMAAGSVLFAEGLGIYYLSAGRTGQKFFPGFWSMWNQSHLARKTGFSVGLVVLAELAVICGIIVWVKRKGIEKWVN